MSWIEILLLAGGLAMDAMAVSIAGGFALRPFRVRKALKIALFYGVAQAVMPMLGWLAGRTLAGIIAAFDHWVAFGLLVAIGLKMLIESFRGCESKFAGGDPAGSRVLLPLAFATSLDALTVGFSLCILGQPLVVPALVIGLVTFCLCFAGVCIGWKLGHLFERKVEALGGLILIGIGVKILFEHIGV